MRLLALSEISLSRARNDLITETVARPRVISAGKSGTECAPICINFGIFASTLCVRNREFYFPTSYSRCLYSCA